MGLLNKIKNVLFEEEEIEIPVEEKEEKKVEKKKINFEEEKKEEVYQDHELYKAEKTFDFPIFDDQEFDNMNNKNIDDVLEEEESNKNLSINLFDYENPRAKKETKRPKAPEIKGRAYDNKAADFDKRKFKPSPVISPVYGVLDKNYKKEDIVVIKQEAKKSIDVEEVRKKAFGTLEDDIEKNKKEPLATKKEEKSIDELLEETAFDTIELPDFKEEETENTPIFNDDEDVDISLEELDKREKKEEESEDLENDLFDLIDSMYENKEEEE